MVTASLDFARKPTLYLGRRERLSDLGGILQSYKNVAVAEAWSIEKLRHASRLSSPTGTRRVALFLEVVDDINSTDPPAPGW